MVRPAWAVLPMGFTWSLYFTQASNTRLAAQASRLLGAPPPLTDRGPPLVVEAAVPAAGGPPEDQGERRGGRPGGRRPRPL
eukprot:7182721-Lingulodinium_polyedra.AAC.1